MTHYRYHAETNFGVPIYGTQYAASEPELRAILASRNLRLVQCGELAVDAALAEKSATIPRAIQLRFGERLREALITGIPAHEAVRALATEPIEHPVVSIMPWVFLTSVFLCATSLVWILVYPPAIAVYGIAVVGVLMVIPMSWGLAQYFLIERPRRLLHRIADDLERGNTELLQGGIGFQAEVNAVLRSNISSQKKAMAVADLIPALSSGRFFQHQTLLGVGGLYLITSFFALCGYWIMAYMIPQYRKIYEDFDINLPVLTAGLVKFSSWFEFLGLPGLMVVLTLLGIGLFAIVVMASTPRLSDLLAKVPVIGQNAQWLMQARVARVIASLVRQNCDRAVIIRTATSGSLSRTLRVEGEYVASNIERGGIASGGTTMLTSLPLSLLLSKTAEGHEGETATSRIAQSFSALASMLERACQGRTAFLIMVFQIGLTFVMSFIVGMTVIALFLPLMKLLNDLS